jgi:tRNA wybutosine-synthesizing protein 3
MGKEPTPMVAIRSMGLSFESLIGIESKGMRSCVVSEDYLTTIVRLANERFVENEKRIARFREALQRASLPKQKAGWEDAETRRMRKREEGLLRKAKMEKAKSERALDMQDEHETLEHQDLV